MTAVAPRPCFWERARRLKHARRKARPRDSLKPGPGATAVKKPLFYQSSMHHGLASKIKEDSPVCTESCQKNSIFIRLKTRD